MRSSVRDLTAGPLWSGILFFSVPLIFSNLLQILFNLSDIAVIGQFGGPVSLGAVGSTTTLITLFTTFIIGFSNGINVITARFLGQKHEAQVRAAVHTSLLLSLAEGFVLLLTGEAGTRTILSLLQTKPELFAGASLYLRICFLGMPALSLYNFGNAVFSASGDTRKPLLFLTVSGIMNVVLNLIFVILFRLDVAGVALASVISQYFTAVCVLVSLIRRSDACALRLSCLRAGPGKAAMILALGLVSGLQNAIFQIANLFVQYGVNTFDAVTVAGNAAAQNADGLAYDAMAAVYTACGSYIGQNYGAGRMDRVKKTYLISLFYSFAFGLGIGLTLFAWGTGFLSLFTRDSGVLTAGMYRLTVMAVCYGFSAPMDCSNAASRGLGRAAVPTVFVILGSCVFRLLWIFTVFRVFHTITVLYLLYIFSWTLTGAAEVLYFVHTYRRCRKELELRGQAA